MHLIGVDLGRQTDYAAPVVFEDRLVQKPVTILPDGVPARYRGINAQLVRMYDCVHLEQVRGMSYPMVAQRVKRLVENPLISEDYVLVVDSTGVGLAVLDMMRDLELNPVGITFTAGREVTMGEHGYNVPKRDLVVNMQLLYQSGRIRVAAGLELAQTFRDQLKGYTWQTTPSGKSETFGAGTEDLHDDLVTSAAMVMWYAEKVLGPRVDLPWAAPGDNGKPFNPATFGLS